ncbi:MAG: TolC family protein, partial [Candidatus Poribacteria bacterium]
LVPVVDVAVGHGHPDRAGRELQREVVQTGGVASLDEAVEHAWANHPDISLAREGILATEGQVTQSRAPYFPSLNLTGSYTYNGVLPKSVLDFGGGPSPFGAQGVGDQTDPTAVPPVQDPAQSDVIEIEFGTRDDYRAVAQTQWSVFTWGKTANGYRQAQAGLRAAEHRLTSTRRDVALRAIQAFYGVIVSEQVVTVAERAHEQSASRLGIVQKRLDAGVVTRLDLLRAQVGLANANTQLIRARNGAELARRGFALAIGLHPSEDVSAAGELEYAPTEESLADLMAAALARRPELKELSEREIAAEHLARIAKAGNKPNVARSGTYTWNDTEKQDPQRTWSVGAGISFPILDGFATRSRSRQAESAQRQVALNVESLRRGISLEVQQEYLSYHEATAVLEAQHEAVAQAEEALRIANLSFENGLITSVELADAELANTQTQLAQIQALHDTVIARARLARATGAELP